MYKHKTLSAADNIPVIFHSARFTEHGVDTAAYLVIKPTGGYGMVTGGATADSGKPDRTGSGKPLLSAELNLSHYGASPVKDAGVVVPAIKTCVTSSCDIGVITLLPYVPSPS